MFGVMGQGAFRLQGGLHNWLQIELCATRCIVVCVHAATATTRDAAVAAQQGCCQKDPI